MNKNSLLILLVIACCGLGGFRKAPPAAKDKRPNIIIILSDDMGYSDIGCYGGEINTPNLDALAKNGLRYTRFYNTSRCCPSRASLLTGLYPHQTGIGWMTAEDHKLPGYSGELNRQCVTLAEVVKEAGYATYMTGKWHLALDPKKGAGQQYDWPLQRGFDKYYGTLLGAANYYDPGMLCRGNTLITPYTDALYPSKDYYFTRAVSDNSVRFIREHDDSRPFFLYVAYTAAHWPMQAPAADIKKYKGKYDAGWEEVRRRRFEKMKRLGLVKKDEVLSPSDVPAWASEKDKAAMLRRMETYAAMVDIMDEGIGNIVQELKRKGQLENTVIFYLQDNGACHEIIGSGETRPAAPDTSKVEHLTPQTILYTNKPLITRDGRFVMQGRGVMAGPADTYISYMQEWANVSNTPFRLYKHWIHEGGISTPMIVHWPAGIKQKGVFRNQVAHEIDIMPTIVQLSGAQYPTIYHEQAITPEEGLSLVPTFGNAALPQRLLFWEHEMNRGVRLGQWKLVAQATMLDGGYGTWQHYKTDPWELYDIDKDREELHDLSSSHPDIVAQLSKRWDEWAQRSHVFPQPWQPKN